MVTPALGTVFSKMVTSLGGVITNDMQNFRSSPLDRWDEQGSAWGAGEERGTARAFVLRTEKHSQAEQVSASVYS